MQEPTFTSEPHGRICAVITEETTASAIAAIKLAAGVADMIELRLDYLRDFDYARPENLSALLENKPLPAIITCRAIDEGGKQFIEDQIRLRLLIEGARSMADYCDIEAASYFEALKLSPDVERLIVSYHNFEQTPQQLNDIYERITRLPAAMHKIATRANRLSDSLSIFGLLRRAQAEGRNLIAIAIGEPGLITRILGPAHGSFLTYGSIKKGRESAPGQLTCEQLRAIYRVGKLSRETIITGIVGQRLGHTASPAMHNAAFEAMDMDCVYIPIETDDVAEFFARFVAPSTREVDWRLRGFSVTIPHKTSIAAYLDDLDTTVRKAGAANTVVINGQRLAGYNTDMAGAMKPLEEMITLEGAKCGVIGAGGAARATVCGLTERGAQITLFARDGAKARHLAESFGVPLMAIASLESSDVDIVINTTPVGMKGHSQGDSPVVRAALKGRKIAYDLIYNPLETRFLKEAREEGCLTITGMEMLIEQAALQFELWTGQRPPEELMHAAALKRLAAESE